MEARPIIDNVTALAMEAIHAGDSRNTDDPERLRFELDRLQQKKEAVLDHYFSGEISKNDMQAMKKRYEDQIKSYQRQLEKTEAQQGNIGDTLLLKQEIQAEISALLDYRAESEMLSKSLLKDLTVFPDKHLELRLNDLPMVFWFAG